MKFTKNKHPRGGGRQDPNSKAGQKRAQEAAARLEKEKQAFEDFTKAESGFFNGFSFATPFHVVHKKAYAIETISANDSGDAVTREGATIHAGADGITVYVMTAEAERGDVKKVVRFNTSVYVF